MARKIIWLLVSFLMILSLVMASCGQKAAEEAKVTEEEEGKVVITEKEKEEEKEEEVVQPSSDEPQYGGTLTIPLSYEMAWNGPLRLPSTPHELTHNHLWDGDWAKGIAGGYGTNEADWRSMTNVPDLMTGYLAESWRFEVNSEAQTVTTIIQVRQGVHWALDPSSEASRLINGRQLTADDIVSSLDQQFNNPLSSNIIFAPYLMDLNIHPIKTGPWEVSLTLPLKDHLSVLIRAFQTVIISAPEIMQKGIDFAKDWHNDIGTGPFMMTDYVPGSMTMSVRNPNYFLKDPVGPGKGNQLPYIDKVRFVIIPDQSTRDAALRTANVDWLGGFGAFTPESAADMRSRIPALKEAPGDWGGMPPIYMRTDLAPYNDIRVRQAMMMATDFNTINENLYSGVGQILTWPYYYLTAYADLYLGLDDPEMPASVKELYTYNPDKARQLLTEAGYPDGFKTEIIILNTEADYYSVIKDMWFKVGIDMSLKIVDSGATKNSMIDNMAYTLIAYACSPPGTYPEQLMFYTKNRLNPSLIDDPIANEAAEKAQIAAITDFRGAMKITKELMKHLLLQAYAIPSVRYEGYSFWWPWLKNYSGETNVGYQTGYAWTQWVWYDQALKKSMGY